MKIPTDFTGCRCDFCCDEKEKVVHAYPAIDFVVNAMSTPNLTQISDSFWAACAICKPLVDSENWLELARRSARGFCRKYPGMPRSFDEMVIDFVKIYDEFNKARLDK